MPLSFARVSVCVIRIRFKSYWQTGDSAFLWYVEHFLQNTFAEKEQIVFPRLFLLSVFHRKRKPRKQTFPPPFSSSFSIKIFDNV